MAASSPSKSILRRPEDSSSQDPSDRDPLLKRQRRVSYGITTEVPASESTSSSSDLNSTFTNEDNNNDNTPSKKKLTPRQWQILIVILVATCGSSFAVCLFPPFFPRLAEEKGATAGIYGFIIGTNCLVSFLVTPFIGKNLPQFGIYYSIVNGMIVGGICCALSGFLEFFSPGPHFVIVAVVIRAVHATGNAFVITATFTYAAVEFENSVGTIFSLTRFAMNFAQLLGPSIGGAIYQAGGFYLPFVAMGSLQMLMGLLSIFCLPRSRIDEDGYVPTRSEGNNGLKISIVNVLKIPTIWFSFMAFIVATVCNGFLSINLEPKVLRRFDLAPFYVGVLFGLKDGANCLSNPVWGYICDRKRDNSIKHYLVLSALFVALSFVLMGAGSIVNVDINLSMPLLIVALCFNGVGIGGQQVAGVVDALHEAVNAGYPDDPAMHGLIAGLWSSLSGLGRFTSRVGSGLLVDCIGFDKTAFIVVGLQVIIGAITLFYTVFCECTLKVRNSVQREDEVSIIDEEESEVGDNNIGSHDLEAGNGLPVFRDSTRSSSGTVTAKNSVSIDVPPSQRSNRGNRKSRGGAAGAGGSLQPHTTASGSVSSISSYPYSLPHSYFNTAE